LKEERRTTKLKYENAGEVGLLTVALLVDLNEGKWKAQRDENGFLTWSKLQGIARLAFTLLSALVIGRAA